MNVCKRFPQAVVRSARLRRGSATSLVAAALTGACATPYAPHPESQAAYLRPGLIGDTILNPPHISVRRVDSPGKCSDPMRLSFFATPADKSSGAPSSMPATRTVGQAVPPPGAGQPEFLMAPGLHQFNVSLSAGVHACSLIGTVNLVQGQRHELIAAFSAQRRSCHGLLRRWRDGAWQSEPLQTQSCDPAPLPPVR